MPSPDATSHGIREFSLAELVEKISRLERRRQEDGGTREVPSEKEGAERRGEGELGPELTE